MRTDMGSDISQTIGGETPAEDWDKTVQDFDPGLDLRPLDSTDHNFDKSSHFYYGQGKLLLTGEYFVLDGAKALALPTQVGQSLNVRYSQSFQPILHWKSYDVRGRLWLEARFEFWHFDCLDENPSKEVLMLQKVLRQVRKQNSHFLRDEVDVHVETHLGFPLDWGLGSSSTFIYNVAQWAYVSPFELLFETYGGSGYDIACAQSEGPIIYQRDSQGINWKPIIFEPEFSSDLYFVFLGQKQNSRKAISYYKKVVPEVSPVTLEKLSDITEQMLEVRDIEGFESLIETHERVVSDELQMETVKQRHFPDFWGKIKSLGAWGGDFVLATSQRSEEETLAYFRSKGHSVALPYRQLILDSRYRPQRGEAGHGNIH